MKTYKHLYPQIFSFENLYLAFKKAARGKRSRQDVAAFEFNLEQNLVALQEELQSEQYQPGHYFSFRIHDPKPRLISAAPFRDRVVHHALCIKFPRQQRFVIAAVLQQEALCFQSLLIEAAHQDNPMIRLNAADSELDKLRTHLRLSRDLRLLSVNSYEHASRMLVEIGKLLGGWKKSIAV